MYVETGNSRWLLRYDELDVVAGKMEDMLFEENELELDDKIDRLPVDVRAADAGDKFGDADEDFCNGGAADSDGDNGAIDNND